MSNESLHNIAAHLSAQARDNPQQMAIACPNADKTYTSLTYKELDERSDVIARGLHAHGIHAGMRCVLMVTPSIEFFTLTFALFKISAVMVCIDPGIGMRSLRICIRESQAHAFIGIPKAHIARKLLRWSAPELTHFICVGDTQNTRKKWFGMPTYNALIAAGTASSHSAWHHGCATDAAAILFTSGSTGIPKGVAYSHHNFIQQVEALRTLYDIQAGEVDLCTFPLFALFSPALGMSAVIPAMDFTKPGSVHPPHIIDPIQHFQVNQMFGSPALLKQVAAYGLTHQVRMPSLKRVLSAGAPVPPQVIADFSQMLNDDCQIFTPYGATESLPVASVGSRDILEKYRSANDHGKGTCVGHPAPNMRIHIIPISDDVIHQWNPQLIQAPNVIGEIIVQGAVVTAKYFNRPHATMLAKIPETGSERFFHRMGDLGYLDDDGALWFCGRKAHRVNTANKLFFSVPCEAIFNQHPLVMRSALVSLNRDGADAAEICAGICVELHPHNTGQGKPNTQQLGAELHALGAAYDHCIGIEHFFIHPAFPVDIRHNAKINRERLSQWARTQKHLAL